MCSRLGATNTGGATSPPQVPANSSRHRALDARETHRCRPLGKCFGRLRSLPEKEEPCPHHHHDQNCDRRPGLYELVRNHLTTSRTSVSRCSGLRTPPLSTYASSASASPTLSLPVGTRGQGHPHDDLGAVHCASALENIRAVPVFQPGIPGSSFRVAATPPARTSCNHSRPGTMAPHWKTSFAWYGSRDPR